jgi:predicted hydrocarbon binding protein
MSISPSGFYYPNKIARITFESAEQVLGSEKLATLLREIGLERYIDAFPPENLQRQFDFADFSALMAGVDALQAQQPRTPTLGWEIGTVCYKGGLKTFGALSSFGAVAMGIQVLPQNLKIKMGLLGMVTVFTTLSDQLSDVEEHEDHFAYVIHRCPVCIGRHSDTPICVMAGSMIEAGLHWLTQDRYSVVETRCIATGDDECRFVINKTPLR